MATYRGVETRWCACILEKTRDEVRNIFSEAGGFAMEPYNPYLVSPVWNMLNMDLSNLRI
jgi:hypothetical protein